MVSMRSPGTKGVQELKQKKQAQTACSHKQKSLVLEVILVAECVTVGQSKYTFEKLWILYTLKQIHISLQ